MLKDLKRVEIELHSSCNRDCPWCINHYTKSRDVELSEEAFLSVLKSLKDNDFEHRIVSRDVKTITLNGYSEPTLKLDLLIKRTNQIRDIMPGVDIAINTNGDFLCDRLFEEAALDKMAIMDYDMKGKEYWLEQLAKYGILVVSQNNELVVGTHKRIRKIVCMIDWPLNFKIENRAGFLPRVLDSELAVPEWKNGREKRTAPCYEPLFFPVINADGNVMPCCHMRADTHGKFILGNVYDSLLHEILSGEKYINIKSIFSSPTIDNYPEECLYCNKEREDIFSGIRRLSLKEEFKDIGTNKNKLSVKNLKRSPMKDV